MTPPPALAATAYVGAARALRRLRGIGAVTGAAGPDRDVAERAGPRVVERVPERSLQTGTARSAGRRKLVAAAIVTLLAAAVVLAVAGLPWSEVAASAAVADGGLVLAALAAMVASALVRARAWMAMLRAALPEEPLRYRDVLSAYLVGVMMSATLPARIGEPSRAIVLARRLSRPRDQFAVVIGTIASQSLLNGLALIMLGAAALASAGAVTTAPRAVLGVVLAPVALIGLIGGLAYAASRLGARPGGRIAAGLAAFSVHARRVPEGLRVFRRPRLAREAAGAQLASWALLWLACWLVMAALGLDSGTSAATAAAVLFAVNITAVVPLLPGNVGIYQAATVAVLYGGYGLPIGAALAYGLLLQALELFSSLALGSTALAREGLGWRELRERLAERRPAHGVQAARSTRRRLPAGSTEASRSHG